MSCFVLSADRFDLDCLEVKVNLISFGSPMAVHEGFDNHFAFVHRSFD
jgi:hypothetical protein